MKRLSLPPGFQNCWFARIASPALTIALSVGATSPAVADYVPPERSAPRAGNTIPGVVRGTGCSAAFTTGLLPFAPQSHIGQTTDRQPTFLWFTPESTPYQTEFQVAEHLSDGRFNVIYATEFESTDKRSPSGISSVSLRGTDVQLSPGTTYRWQVVLKCNPNRPAESLIAEADVTVLEAPSPLESALANAATPAERSAVYAEAGMWYDALAETMGTRSLPLDPATQQTLQIDLLEDLADIEDQATDRESGDGVSDAFGDRIRAVIDRLSSDT